MFGAVSAQWIEKRIKGDMINSSNGYRCLQEEDVWWNPYRIGHPKDSGLVYRIVNVSG